MTKQEKKTDRYLKDLIDKSQQIANSKGFNVDWDNAPTYLMLIVTELSEAIESGETTTRRGLGRRSQMLSLGSSIWSVI